MGRTRITVAAVTFVAILPLVGCAGDAARSLPLPSAPSATAVRTEYPRYAVGWREVELIRGDDRPLRTVLLYPAAGPDSDPMRINAVPANGKFPLVLFSH